MTEANVALETAGSAASPNRYPAHVGAARLYGDEFHRDPAAVYDQLRARHGAVAPVLMDGDIPAWIVLGYREFAYVLENPELYTRDSTLWNAWDLVPSDWPALPIVVGRDTAVWLGGLAHERRSTVLHDGLTVDPFELRARCERIADELIDTFAPTGEADLISQYAELLPVHALGAVLGIPPADCRVFTRDVITVVNGAPDAQEAFVRWRAGLQRQVVARRENLGFDVLSRLLTHPASLTDGELLEEMVTVFSLAHEMVSSWIGNSLRLMLGDPRFAATMFGGRRSVGDAMAQVLWEDTPAQSLTGRWLSRPSQLGSYQMAAGDMVIPSVTAANADPRVRPRSGIVETAGNQAHLSYGHGEHRCPLPAQEIGEVIAETAVRVLLDRLPDVTLAVPLEDLVWRPTIWIRGLTALPVVFGLA
ncbi:MULTISPECIES: cytochrome P450 [unclassified Pseudofrankia]|uniref:cytochrome P450 n=1 Tax=unclassified Pseudofrankia TaxID=2994372 RepID=UPI0008D9BC36|nr:MULTISPECIES: cytochrome P450 [unclassified Pseudofrankia]MDT3445041.1 cytochrome P450 [Pseudofrankia sp. BMG5.37]OHV47196.1 cytochrome [Pseudofrankia sp. BMG5.36]